MQLLTQWGKRRHTRDVLPMSMPRSAGDGVEGARAPNKTEILARGRVVKYRDWMTCDIKAGLKPCLLAWKANLWADPKTFRVFQHGPNPRSSQLKDWRPLARKKWGVWDQPYSLSAGFYLLPESGQVAGSWARAYFGSGLAVTAVQAQAIPGRVQQHSKPRFWLGYGSRKESQCSNRLCSLQDVANPCTVQGIAWEEGEDFGGTRRWRKDCIAFV